MMRRVRLLDDTKLELAAAFRWYEEQRRGLGLEFLLAFDALVQQIQRMPEGHRVIGLITRKAVLRRFPFVVLYALEGEDVVITAVYHARRDPQAWSDRVREGTLPRVFAA